MMLRSARLLLALGFVLGSVAGCFSPPTDDVLFSCEFDGDDACPPDYRCELDNCCHRIGSDVEAAFGVCAIGGNSSMTGATETGETETETGETETGGTDG
jgi:hypothetical protein